MKVQVSYRGPVISLYRCMYRACYIYEKMNTVIIITLLLQVFYATREMLQKRRILKLISIENMQQESFFCILGLINEIQLKICPTQAFPTSLRNVLHYL